MQRWFFYRSTNSIQRWQPDRLDSSPSDNRITFLGGRRNRRCGVGIVDNPGSATTNCTNTTPKTVDSFMDEPRMQHSTHDLRHHHVDEDEDATEETENYSYIETPVRKHPSATRIPRTIVTQGEENVPPFIDRRNGRAWKRHGKEMHELERSSTECLRQTSESTATRSRNPTKSLTIFYPPTHQAKLREVNLSELLSFPNNCPRDISTPESRYGSDPSEMWSLPEDCNHSLYTSYTATTDDASLSLRGVYHGQQESSPLDNILRPSKRLADSCFPVHISFIPWTNSHGDGDNEPSNHIPDDDNSDITSCADSENDMSPNKADLSRRPRTTNIVHVENPLSWKRGFRTGDEVEDDSRDGSSKSAGYDDCWSVAAVTYIPGDEGSHTSHDTGKASI